MGFYAAAGQGLALRFSSLDRTASLVCPPVLGWRSFLSPGITDRRRFVTPQWIPTPYALSRGNFADPRVWGEVGLVV